MDAERAPEPDPAAPGDDDAAEESHRALACLRCEALLEHIGARDLGGGATGGMLAELAEIFGSREPAVVDAFGDRHRLEVWACPLCGHVEMFRLRIVEPLPDDADVAPAAPGDDTAVTVSPWTCPGCTETVPGHFDVCWSCGAPRPAEPGDA